MTELTTVLSWFNDWFCAQAQPQLSRQILIQCQTLLAEGFTNAVRHAHRDQAPQTPIELTVSLLEQQIELCIWDMGPEFDLEQRLQNNPHLPKADATGGRGIQLITRLADGYSYRRIGSRNCLQITKSTVAAPL